MLLDDFMLDVFSLVVGDAEVRLDDSVVEILDCGSSLDGDVKELFEVGAESFVDVFV